MLELFSLCLVVAFTIFCAINARGAGKIIFVTIAVFLAIITVLKIESTRNMRTVEPKNFSSGYYRIACKEKDGVILVYDSWLEKKKSRAVLVPTEKVYSETSIPDCVPVAVSVSIGYDGADSVIVKKEESP